MGENSESVKQYSETNCTSLLLFHNKNILGEIIGLYQSFISASP